MGENTLVTNVQYNAAGQLTHFDKPSGGGENRSYNVLGQVTRITHTGDLGQVFLDREYRYPATANNGRITQMKDWKSGEEASYQYDTLSRLISAVTTGPEWKRPVADEMFPAVT